MILAELSKNLGKQRETKEQSEGKTLTTRMKELEALNLKDRGYNDMFDKDFEHPMYKRHQMG
jgi:hypothetical protein